ncbi:hypothetical protein BAUCODRAFT_376563 [Baudoinia panamericana UAMH 10762]|uniref:SET domain-containing protein n=1 Tax=Baudoinia panamericana (strain UAMH 10762) TaxID=717646 RepID=M2MPH7_BAUPA|nr:uncharacterized protein BAUCODRAFT_376563 [Baudoinia panamericana UAMH 10762]EMC98646.1 hypothetical protein BAUCODRAFT_376563 [Baudoinia panamericana UAMH 10762]
MYRIGHAGPTKGLGVFASRCIPRGTCIMAETPLLSVRSESEVFAAVRGLNNDARSRFLSLSSSVILRSLVLGWSEAAWHAFRALITEGTAQSPPSRWRSIIDHPNILNVFRNNNFDLGDGRQAVFDKVSRINHSCIPNAQGNFNAALGRFTIYAVRQIEREEEVTLSYLAETAALRDARQARLIDHYGFLCGCFACDANDQRGRKVEEGRRRMHERLREFADVVGSDGSGHSQQTELEVMWKLVKMYEAEGVAGREVATICLRAAELAAKAGKRADALAMAEKGLRMEKDCLGADSPMYGASVERARSITNGHDACAV